MEQTFFDGKILIEPVINKKVHGIADHARKFRYGLKIRNIDERISPDFIIDNVTLESAHNQNIIAVESKTFFVPRLNAQEEKFFDIGEHSSFMHGLVKIGADLSPIDKERTIACYQRMPTTNSFLFARSNGWVDFFYIKSPQEIMHEKIIARLKWLTVVVLLFILVEIAMRFYF